MRYDYASEEERRQVRENLRAKRKARRANGEPPGEADIADLPIIAVASFAGRPAPARPWHVPDMIPGRQVTLLGGDDKVGKSIIAMQLAVASVANREWVGKLPLQGPVVYLSAEDDTDELNRRFEAIAASYGVDLAELGDIKLIPMADRDAVMAAPAKPGIVTPTAVWRGLVAKVELFKPRFVIVDTLADVFAGNENIRSEARQFIGLLRGLAINFDLAILLLAHPSLSGLRDGTGTSGSTGWSNSVRSRLYLERLKDDQNREIEPDLRTLSVKRSNYGPADMELRLRWSGGCFELDGTAAGGIGALAAGARAERVFCDLLATYIGQGRDVSPNRSNAYAPTEFAKHPAGKAIGKDALEAAMNRAARRRPAPD